MKKIETDLTNKETNIFLEFGLAKGNTNWL